MNKRIEKLIGEALDSEMRRTWDTMDYGDLEHFSKKFAELIVRECVEQCKLIQSQTVTNGSEEYVAGREMGIEVFMNQIQKHFGVE